MDSRPIGPRPARPGSTSISSNQFGSKIMSLIDSARASARAPLARGARLQQPRSGKVGRIEECLEDLDVARGLLAVREMTHSREARQRDTLQQRSGANRVPDGNE